MAKDCGLWIAAGLLLHRTVVSGMPDVQGRLEIRWPARSGQNRGFGKAMYVCAKNFEHAPRSEPCHTAPNDELRIEPEVGMIAKGAISTTGHGSRQVDFPFRFTWPVSTGGLSISE